MGTPCLEPFQKTASYISHWIYVGNFVEQFAIWTSGGRLQAALRTRPQFSPETLRIEPG